MKLTEFFLTELEAEAAGTRHAIERVPEGRNDWKPHEKSMPLGYLAALVATMPGWIEMMINRDELDFSAPDQPRTPEIKTREELLRTFSECRKRRGRLWTQPQTSTCSSLGDSGLESTFS